MSTSVVTNSTNCIRTATLYRPKAEALNQNNDVKWRSTHFQIHSGTFTALNVSYKNPYSNITARSILENIIVTIVQNVTLIGLCKVIFLRIKRCILSLKDNFIHTFRAKMSRGYEREVKERTEDEKRMD